MKKIRLTSVVALVFCMAIFCMAWASVNVYGQDVQNNEDVEADQQAVTCARDIGCDTPDCNHSAHGQVCARHGRDCRHGCLGRQYGYGRMGVCPGKTNGVCPVHGYGACPHPRQPIGPALQQFFGPADRPYFGTQPLYVPREQYDPNFQPRFPMFRAMFLAPPAPRYMATAPPEPMPTYTTRGPRDFLNPNPPSIGY